MARMAGEMRTLSSGLRAPLIARLDRRALLGMLALCTMYLRALSPAARAGRPERRQKWLKATPQAAPAPARTQYQPRRLNTPTDSIPATAGVSQPLYSFTFPSSASSPLDAPKGGAPPETVRCSGGGVPLVEGLDAIR